jgi:hypothetical protein
MRRIISNIFYKCVQLIDQFLACETFWYWFITFIALICLGYIYIFYLSFASISVNTQKILEILCMAPQFVLTAPY